MQNTQEINWLVIIVPGLITGGFVLFTQIILALWLSKKTESYKTDLIKEIEDYKENKEARQYRLSKLEELHCLLTQYNDIVDSYKVGVLELSQSEFKPEEYNIIRKELYKITKIQSSIGLYARELGADFDKLVEALNKLLDEGKKLAKRETLNSEKFRDNLGVVFGIRRQLREDLEKICDSYTGLYLKTTSEQIAKKH